MRRQLEAYGSKRWQEALKEYRNLKPGPTKAADRGLVRVLSKAHETKLALDVIKPTTAPACAAFIKSLDHSRCLDHVRPLPFTELYPHALRLCHKHDDWEHALEVLREAPEDLQIETWNIALAILKNAGQWRKALELIFEHRPWNVRSYNTVLATLMPYAMTNQCMEVMDLMDRRGVEKTVVTYSTAISVCENAGEWRRALGMAGEMEARGIAKDTICYSALMAALQKGAQDVEWLVEEMRVKNVSMDIVTYGSAICAAAMKDNWQQALNYLHEMGTHRADTICYNSTLSALARAREWQHAAALVDMMDKHSVPKTAVTLNCAIRAHELANQHERGIELLLRFTDSAQEPDQISSHKKKKKYSMRASTRPDVVTPGLRQQIAERLENQALATPLSISSSSSSDLAPNLYLLSSSLSSSEQEQQRCPPSVEDDKQRQPPFFSHSLFTQFFVEDEHGPFAGMGNNNQERLEHILGVPLLENLRPSQWERDIQQKALEILSASVPWSDCRLITFGSHSMGLELAGGDIDLSLCGPLPFASDTGDNGNGHHGNHGDSDDRHHHHTNDIRTAAQLALLEWRPSLLTLGPCEFHLGGKMPVCSVRVEMKRDESGEWVHGRCRRRDGETGDEKNGQQKVACKEGETGDEENEQKIVVSPALKARDNGHTNGYDADGRPCPSSLVVPLDISIRNVNGVLKSRMVREALDGLPDEVRTGCIILKAWARRNRLLGQTEGKLGAFTFTLMVVFAAQIWKKMPKKKVCLKNTRIPFVPFFFYFYTHEFDWRLEAVSIRLGCRSSAPHRSGFSKRCGSSGSSSSNGNTGDYEDGFSKNRLILDDVSGDGDGGDRSLSLEEVRRKDAKVYKKRLCVEDPVETSWDLGALLSDEAVEHVHAALMSGWDLIAQKKRKKKGR